MLAVLGGGAGAVLGWGDGLVGGEHYVGRVEGEVVELREGGEVVDGGLAGEGGGDGGDPTDGARDDAGFEGVVREVVVGFAWFVEHGGGGGVVFGVCGWMCAKGADNGVVEGK